MSRHIASEQSDGSEDITPTPVAVVTGGGSGIGRAIARRLRASGYEVFVADIDRGDAVAAAASIGAMPVRCDVSDRDDVADLAATVRDRFQRLDVLVNSAGVGSAARLESMTADDWRWMLDINLYGVIHVVGALLPLMQENANGGKIVNIASMSAVAPLAGMGAYAVGKAGVLAFSEVLAEELDGRTPPISVSAALPGPVRTRIAESQRHRNPAHSRGLVDVDLARTSSELAFLDPDQAAERILTGMEDGERYIVTHPELWPRVEERHVRIQRAFLSRYAPCASPLVGRRQGSAPEIATAVGHL